MLQARLCSNFKTHIVFGFAVAATWVFPWRLLPSLGSPWPSEDSQGNLNSQEAIFTLLLAARLLRLGYSYANVSRCVVFCRVDWCLFANML